LKHATQGHRALAVGAVESVLFAFALGCVVQFWALFVQHACAVRGLAAAVAGACLLVLVGLRTLREAPATTGSPPSPRRGS
jgi:hypothetical protein